MDPITIISTIASVIKTIADIAPGVIKTVEDAAPFAQEIYNLLAKGENITQADLDALEASVDALVAEALTPLPPDDGTTTT